MNSTTTSEPHPNRTRVLVAFAIVYVVWGSTYLAIRVAVAAGRCHIEASRNVPAKIPIQFVVSVGFGEHDHSPSGLARQRRLHHAARLAEIHLASKFPAQHTDHLAHVLHAGGAGLLDRSGDGGLHFVV